MRDHTKLRAFELADQVVMDVYRTNRNFPREEIFGLTSQIRRASVSTASNIVEGCARHSESDFLRFLDMAYGSSKEVAYQLSIAERLEYSAELAAVRSKCDETAKVLNGLMRSIRNPHS